MGGRQRFEPERSWPDNAAALLIRIAVRAGAMPRETSHQSSIAPDLFVVRPALVVSCQKCCHLISECFHILRGQALHSSIVGGFIRHCRFVARWSARLLVLLNTADLQLLATTAAPGKQDGPARHSCCSDKRAHREEDSGT